MKITSEKAFDMLPYCVDIYEKLNLKEYVKNLTADSKTKNKAVLKNPEAKSDDIEKIQNEIGEDVVKYIVKNNGKVKKEFFAMVAICQDISVDEAMKQSPIKTAKTFVEIFKDKELNDFFKQAMQ